MKILIVDDNSSIRESVETLMLIEGYTSVAARNGVEALNVLKQHRDISVVITDVLMPEMDGIELSRRVMSEFPHVKVIAISGGASTKTAREILQECKNVGIQRVLQKPFTLEELAEAIDS